MRSYDIDPRHGGANDPIDNHFYTPDFLGYGNGFDNGSSYGYSVGPPHSYATANGVAGYAQVEGKVQIVWRWVPIYPNTNAGTVPEKLNFIVRATATATDDSHVGSSTSFIAGRGRAGEQVQASVGLAGSSGQDNSNEQQGGSYQAKGAQLYSIDTQGRTEIPVEEVSVRARADVPGGRSLAGTPIQPYPGAAFVTPYKDDKGKVSVEVAVFAQLDSRSVSLSRQGAAAPLPEKVVVNGMTQDNPALNKSRDEWVEADGTGHGHTRWSYKERILLNPDDGVTPSYSDDSHDVSQTLNVTPVGKWSVNSANLQSHWDFGDANTSSSSTLLSASFTTPQGNAIYNPDGIDNETEYGSAEGVPTQTVTAKAGVVPAGWYNTHSASTGSNGSGSMTVTYDLTDLADSATTTAKYILRLHDEWENATPDPSPQYALDTNGDGTPEVGFSKRERYWVYSTLYATYVPAAATTQPVWKIENTVTANVKFGIKAEGGFKFKDFVNAGVTAESSLDYDISTKVEQDAPLVSSYGDSPPAGTKYYRVLRYQMITQHLLLDRFGPSGFMPFPGSPFPPPANDPNWSKWPQAKDTEARFGSPSWLVIYPTDNRTDPQVGEERNYNAATGRSGGTS